MGKLLERLFGRKESYESVARRIALGDGDVNEFLDSHKKGYSLSVSGVGGRQLVEYLAKNHHHPELAQYADSPERLLCVLVDSRQSGILGIPERDTMRVYVDVKGKKIVAKDILKWNNSSGPSARIIDKA